MVIVMGWKWTKLLEFYRDPLMECSLCAIPWNGDSKAFQKVEESKHYGEGIKIEKLNCVGHVQKRIGTT
jgi:hypothetical protein